MSFDFNKLPEHLVEAARTGQLVPFIGAGVSRQAQSKSFTNPYPTWTVLLKSLITAAATTEEITDDESHEMRTLVDQGKHLMVAQALKNEMQDSFIDLVIQRCAPSDAEPAPIHRRLFALKCPLIVTTNYDRLLEYAAMQLGVLAEVATFRDADKVKSCLRGEGERKPLVFKIHGTIEHRDTIVLAEEDYRNLQYNQPGYRHVLSAIFVSRVVLMMGFSHADPELSTLTESIREAFKHHNLPDYILLPKDEKGPVERRRLAADFGLKVIEYDPANDHAELLEIVDYLAERVKGTPAPGGVIVPRETPIPTAPG